MTRRSPGILLDTDTIPTVDRDSCTLSSVEALIEVYMSANEPQTLRNEYSQATKILDAEYIIKICQNLYVEEQHQLKILLQKYGRLFDGTLGEFKMNHMPISLQLMDSNCKPVHVRAYTVPRSVEQKLQKERKL
jgi:hypothetical protein